MIMTSPVIHVSQHTPPAVAAVPSTRTRRLVGAAVAVASAAVLTLAAFLEPSPTGLGTHSQLNLPACGWIATVDVPCPTCGMTTAFSHAADGHFLAAVSAQPMGALLAVATAMALLVGSFVAATGSPVASLFVRLWSRRTAWVLALAVGGSWIYKILAYKGVLG